MGARGGLVRWRQCPGDEPSRWTLARPVGDLVALGTRSTVHAYGRGAVIKVPVPSTPEGWIRAEAHYADAARGAGAPAPRLLGVELVDGRAASVWERVGGTSMWQLVVDRPSESAALGRVLADVQQGLFGLVPPVTLPRQRDRLVSKIRRAAATVDSSLGRALEFLPPQAGTPRLCHGDLHPSNVLLGPNGPVIVDWFDASRGDPIADVARSSVTLLNDGANPPEHLPGADPATLRVLTGAHLERLREHFEIDDDLLARWQAVSAVGRIAEGVARGPLLDLWTRFQSAAGVPGATN
jgi:aminoglycoside phosphotransferase (APT) family kinase protein